MLLNYKKKKNWLKENKNIETNCDLSTNYSWSIIGRKKNGL